MKISAKKRLLFFLQGEVHSLFPSVSLEGEEEEGRRKKPSIRTLLSSSSSSSSLASKARLIPVPPCFPPSSSFSSTATAASCNDTCTLFREEEKGSRHNSKVDGEEMDGENDYARPQRMFGSTNLFSSSLLGWLD